MDRILTAARLHTLRPLATAGLSWAIVVAVFVVNAIVWRATPETEGAVGSGAVVILAAVMVVSYAQSATQLLPFAASTGLSRRSFYFGSVLAAVIQAAGYALALTLLGAVERATGGWGIDLAFWAPSWIEAANPVLQWLVFTVPLLAASVVGLGLGVVFKRWGAPGMYVLSIAAVVAIGAALALIGWLDAWPQVFGWFADQTAVTFAVTIPAIGALVVGALSVAGLRRVVP